jgi:hypothetical protein
MPYKIKIFTWLMENNAILTKDNMIKRKWTGDPTCLFCTQDENLEHLFFHCNVAKCVWGTVGVCLGADSIPGDINQYKRWIKESLPGGKWCITLVSQLYVGQCGNAGTKRFLTKSG